MPRIELEDQSPTVNTQVHGALIPVREFGSQFGAAARVGEEVAQLGQHLLQKRKEAADSNYAMNAQMDFEKSVSEKSLELQKSLPEGMDGYSSTLQKHMQDELDQRIKDAPSDDARLKFMSDARRFMGQNTIAAEQFENVSKANKYKNDITANVSGLTSGYIDNPNYHNFSQDLDSINKNIDINTGTIFSQDQARDAKLKAGHAMSVGVVEGLIAQKRYGEAKAQIQEGQSVGDAMDPKTKGQYAVHLSNLIKQDQEVTMTSATRQLKDFTYAAQNGLPVNAGDMANVIKTIQNLPTKNKIDLDEKNRMIDQAKVALTVSNDTKQLAILPKSEWSKLPSAQPDNKIWNGPARDNIRSAFFSAAASFEKERNKDPSQSVQDNDPTLKNLGQQALSGDTKATQQFVNQVLSKQKYLQVENPKILSSSQAQYMGDIINKAPTPEAQANAISALQKQFGPYFPQAFSELAEKKSKGGAGINPNLAIAAFVPDAGARQTVVENVVRGPQIMQAFKGQHLSGTDNIVSNQVKSIVSPAINAINRASPPGENSALSQAIEHQVQVETRKLLMDNPGSMKIGDAAKQAYKNIVENNFDLKSGGNSQILIPKKSADLPNNTGLIQNFMVAHSKSDGLKSLGVDLPKGSEDQWLRALESKAKWVPNSDQSGIRLVYPQGNNFIPVKNKLGQNIEAKFQDISNNPDPATRDLSKNKLFGVIDW